MKEVVIVEGVRTPFVKSGTDAKNLPAQDLGKQVLQALFKKIPIKMEEVDEVIFGCVAQPAEAANVARVAMLMAGMPQSIPARTTHRNCASSMQSVSEAIYQIQAGEADVIIAGGTESLSNAPLLYNPKAVDFFTQLSKARSIGAKLGALAGLRPSMFFNPRIGLMEGLTDPTCGLNMGQTAEVLAKEFGISRLDQDTYAVGSHLKAKAARESGRLAKEIAPLYAAPKFEAIVHDNGIRDDSSVEKLAKLPTVFERNNGTVTAGNASQITDGAVALLVMSAEKADALGLKPIAKIKGHAYAGLDPQRMGLGPVYASAKLLEKTGRSMKDIQLAEINEAFAAQVLACLHAFGSDKISKERLGLSKALGEINPDILNVNGGAIALGHPVGTSGGRLLLTLAYELAERDLNTGLATLCVGGGQGAAFLLER